MDKTVEIKQEIYFATKKTLSPQINVICQVLGFWQQNLVRFNICIWGNGSGWGEGGFRIWKNEPFPEFTRLSTFVSTSFVQGCKMVKDNIDIVMVLQMKFDSAFPNVQYIAEDMLLHLDKIEIIMVLKFYFSLEIYLLPW